MKKLALLALATVAAFSAECYQYKVQGNYAGKIDNYCRNIAAGSTVLIYDNVRIETGRSLRAFKGNDRKYTEVLTAIMDENEECYKTCMAANSN